jgi:class 3 adenylate cyclase
MERPETRFAWNREISLAYQVLGTGDVDLLYLPGYISNVELNWEHPTMSRFLRGLAGSRRLIVTDPRGLGCSDRGTPHEVPPLEAIAEDALAVLDAAGSERAAILATLEMGVAACFLASTYPDRIIGLVLERTPARFTWSEETPWAWTEEQNEASAEWFRTRWGTRAGAIEQVKRSDPSMADDPGYIDWWHRYMVLSQAPGAAVAASRRYSQTDIRSILPSIHVPVLVLVRPEGRQIWVEMARFLADRIPGALRVELPGRDTSLWVGDQESVLLAIASFLADVDREKQELERVLATVLFTDIVGSTEKAAALGDRAWRELVERHHAAVRALLKRYRGTEVDTAGDGFFATFDGPARAIRCARAIVDEVCSLGIEVRAGLHTGECETIAGKVGGTGVNIGARVVAAAAPSEVLVSQTVKDLVAGSGLAFEDRGEHELKGVADPWRLYRVVDA